MKIYPEELKAHEILESKRKQENLREEVISNFQEWYRPELKKFRSSPLNHNLISFMVIFVNLFLIIGGVFYLAPKLDPILSFSLAFVLGQIIYGFNVFTLHEGASHQLIFIGKSQFIKPANQLANHLSRFVFVDPLYYQNQHFLHHNHTGTSKDGAYTNFVTPRRFFISLIPLAGALPFCDYKIHDGEVWTKSKILSTILGTFFTALMSYNFLQVGFSPLYIFLFITILFTSSFWFDRLRETVDHNLLEEGKTGARSLGLGFWGLLIGGGPWGQPSHLVHHLAPGLPWYSQVKGHRLLRSLLTKEEKTRYMPLEEKSFPALLAEIISENNFYLKKVVSE